MPEATTGLFATTDIGAASSDGAALARQVIELDRELNQAILEHDAGRASLLYDDDFILTVSGGGHKGKADMLADIRNPDVVLDICETSCAEVRVRGQVAVLTGILRQAGAVGGRSIDVTLQVTDTWVAVDGQWLLLAGHASVAKLPVPAQR